MVRSRGVFPNSLSEPPVLRSDPGDFSFTGFGSNKRGPGRAAGPGHQLMSEREECYQGRSYVSGLETFGLDVAAKFLESNDLKVPWPNVVDHLVAYEHIGSTTCAFCLHY